MANTKSETAKQLVLYRKNLAADYRKANYDNNWIEYHRLYRSVLPDETEYEHMSRLFIPYTFSSIETVIPRMVEAIFSAEPIVAVKPYDAQDVDKAKVLEQLLNYQLNRMDFFRTFINLAKTCLIYGTCIAKVDWRKEFKTKSKVEVTTDEMGFPLYNDDGSPQYKKIKNKYLFYDDPYIYPVDLFKFFVDPKALTLKDAEYVVLVTETTMDRLKDMQSQGIYKNISQVEDVKGSINFDTGKERFSTLDKQSPYIDSSSYGGSNFKSNRVTLYEYWEQDRVITVAEEKVVIRDEENPYWHCRMPFVEGRICPVENEFYGVGIPEMVESLQNELNDVRNARMDNVTLSLQKMFIATRESDILKQFPDGVIPSEPGLIILSNEPDGITPLVVPDVTQSSYMDAEKIKSDIETTLGIYDYSRGAPAKSRETATGILSLQEAANLRFKLMIMELAKMIANASDLMVDLNEQYINEEKVFRLTNQEWQKIDDIEEVIGRYDFVPVGSSMEGLSKYARLEQLLRYRQVFSTNQDFIISKFDMDLLDLLNFKNSAEYFMSMQQPPPQTGIPGAEGMPDIAGMLGQMGQGQGLQTPPGQLPLVAYPSAETAGIQEF